jgi:NAD(P)-dependent dehydrogenase (short-subunit alcohol dehydrogenase family)
MEEVADALGRVDIVVANAGIGGETKSTAEYSDASWHQVIGVNLTASSTPNAPASRRCGAVAAAR